MSNRDGDGEKEESDDEGSVLVDIASIFVVFIVLALMLTLLVSMFGYMDHLTERGTEQACQDKYGESAEYVGETSAFGGSGICDTEDGQKYVERQTAPMGPGTFIDYLSQVDWV